MAAAFADRRRVRVVEQAIEAQCEAEQIETLVDALIAQARTQQATLAVLRTGLARHRETLREAAGAAEAIAS